MSADNGIYIHKFEDGWRVCEGGAIENIYWHADKSGYNQDELKEYFKDSPLYKTEDDALMAARDLYKEWEGCLEYGISFV